MNDFDTFDTDRDGSLSFAVRPPPTRVARSGKAACGGRATSAYVGVNKHTRAGVAGNTRPGWLNLPAGKASLYMRRADT